LELQEQAKKGRTLAKEFADVLLIVTGGTLCMVQTANGYAPMKGLANRLKQSHEFYDKQFADSINLPSEWLVTPVTPLQQRIRFRVLEFDTLIDSSNIRIEDQIKIADTIRDNYKNFDGFVVCHGTDTMAYTSSYLSFMLENLNKTVVITGS
jgi:lysophospholipase